MKRIYLIATIIIAFMFIAFPLYHSHQERFFSCTAHFQASYKDTYLRAMFRFTFIGEEGTASLRGEVKDSQEKKSPLNRMVFFSFKEKNEIYNMSSTGISKENTDRVDDALLEKLIYSFYLQERQTIQYNIAQQNNGDYVIYNGSLPLAYCHKNGH